jgi:hypothetical protein
MNDNNKTPETARAGHTDIRISFVRAEKSMLHSGRNESKLNVNAFKNSNADNIICGQFTPLRTPSLSDERPAISRTHANDWNPDNISFIPLAVATSGGNDTYVDKMANKISKTMARAKTATSLDSGHFLQK